MALDLTGIENVDFYSAHYLDAVLEGDLKAQFARWIKAKEEHGKRQPWDALAALANPFFELKARAEGERDEEERLTLVRDFHARLMEALGYERSVAAEELDDKGTEACPVALALQRDGHPFLWVIETPWPGVEGDDDDGDPLAAKPHVSQLPDGADAGILADATWRELLDDRIFRAESRPRFVLVLAGREILLAERTKWGQGRYLRFDLVALFARREAKALRAMAGLLHRDVLSPDDGLCLHDTLDESSHKHAFAVSSDLKLGVRRAVELIGNEAIWYRQNVQRARTMSEEELAPRLTNDCLTWLYRMLFLFYVEARGSEVGVVPMRSQAYRKGYSLESLRDLELVPLTSDTTRNGYFLHDSLQKLFRIVNDGFGAKAGELLFEPSTHGMQLDALNSPLFDDDRLSVLKGVRFRNSVLQQVLQLLSLSAEKKGKTRGRISYAQLGINQLGAVYEGILSYTGFFAREELFEVASAKDVASGDAMREDTRSYFIEASRAGEYDDTEFVRDAEGRKICHPKGTFIFRLSGRSREKSASYYTPEVLTRCVVKYALKELLFDDAGRPKFNAQEILALTICEPAMGSGAFLNEAVDQLADHYLETRQRELGESIASDDYAREKRRVKARLATNNCFGVDLNPIAAELAKVSLWLATMHEDGKCPFFGLRLAEGNSLIGARRQVFRLADLTRSGTTDSPNWLQLVPEWAKLSPTTGERVRVDEHWRVPKRPKESVYHFLVPASGMADFDGIDVVKQLRPEVAQHIKSWRKGQTTPFSASDGKRLVALSDAVDRLFAQVVRERIVAIRETSDRVAVWRDPLSTESANLWVRDQEEVQRELESTSSAYQRLKLVMDLWCALWFWPIDGANLLPTREHWLRIMELVLLGVVSTRKEQARLFATGEKTQANFALGASRPATISFEAASGETERLGALRALSDRFAATRTRYADECGVADIAEIVKADPTLQLAVDVANRRRFHHWELRFADVFAERGGFDLILGNPPWIKLQWQEVGVLSDLDPSLAIRDVAASDVAIRRDGLLTGNNAQALYFDDLVEMGAAQAFLNDGQNYPLLKGIQSNLYKCFLIRAWENGSARSTSGFLHPEGVYDDPKGGWLRTELYPRLRHHYQFINEHHLFPEVDHHSKYAVNVYGPPRLPVTASSIANLFHPSTIDESWGHDGHGLVFGYKDEEDRFCTRGHLRRIVRIDAERLALFASLYDDAGTPPLRARLPVVHSEEIVEVLRKFAAQPRRLGDLNNQYFSTVMFDETNSQKDGTLRRETRRAQSSDEWIVQGPHFYVGNALYQTPNEVCDSNGAYTRIDLTAIGDDYLPRTNYVRACDPETYARRIPKWNGRPVTGFYRLVNRRMLSVTGERTLITAIIPPGVGHVHTVVGTAMSQLNLLLVTAGLTASVPMDFFLKTTGRQDMTAGGVAALPGIDRDDPMTNAIRRRVARLACITASYSDLWDQTNLALSDALDTSAIDDRRNYVAQPAQKWTRKVAFRSDFERRSALVEVDVLSAMVLGLSFEELITLYKVQFSILQQYERDDRYDQHGRLVPISSIAAGNPAVNLLKLAELLREQTGFDVRREYRPDDAELAELRRKPIRLSRRDAQVLGVEERCHLGDLLAETTVRWSDAEHPEGRPAKLVGIRYTDPGLEPRMERVYPTPWTRCDREEDYRVAWAEFERRFGTNVDGSVATSRP